MHPNRQGTCRQRPENARTCGQPPGLAAGTDGSVAAKTQSSPSQALPRCLELHAPLPVDAGGLGKVKLADRDGALAGPLPHNQGVGYDESEPDSVAWLSSFSTAPRAGVPKARQTCRTPLSSVWTSVWRRLTIRLRFEMEPKPSAFVLLATAPKVLEKLASIWDTSTHRSLREM